MNNQIQEINTHIKDALNQWANICLRAEADQWAYRLNYDKMDLMNACYVFQHVCSNIGIKNGRINIKNTEDFGNRLRQLIIDMTGIDPHHIFEEQQ